MKTFSKIAILGILTAFLAILAEQMAAVFAQFFSSQEIIFPSYDKITWFLFLAVVTEEGLKYSALRYAIWDRFGIRGKKFVAAGFFFGIFFGTSEIGLILFSNPEAKALALNFDREIIISLSSIIFIQTATSLFIGSLIATQKKIKRLSFLRILIFPVLIHLLYNFLVIQKGDYTNFLVLATLIISYLVSFAVIAFNWQGLD